MAAFSFNRSVIDGDVTVFEVAGEPTREQWRNVLESCGKWLQDMEARGRKSLVIVDPSRLENLGASLRRDAGHWRGQNMAVIANVIPRGAYVAPSPWVRGAITAVFWFARPVVPVGVKASRKEALAWLRSYRRT